MSEISLLLREDGWELNNYAEGTHDCLCPYCSHLRRKHPNQKCARVWIESDYYATYCCLHCGKTGYVKADNKEQPTRGYTRPQVKPVQNINLADEFLKQRQISQTTADYLGWFVAENALAMPFYKAGEIVNVKYRGLKEKTFMQEKNPEPVLYNYDNAMSELKNNDGMLIIVEGEIDCATFVEAGYKSCVSLPSGSDSQVRERDYIGKKFDFIKQSEPLLFAAKVIVLALDSDSAGQAMTQSLINMLPKEKLYKVDWSVYNLPGCKDANDFWRKDKSVIKDAIDHIAPIEESHILPMVYDVGKLEQYLTHKLKGDYTTGYSNMETIASFNRGNFVTITGYPGSGKSTWIMSVLFNMAKNHDAKCLYCSFENPNEQVAGCFLQMAIGEMIRPADEYRLSKARSQYNWLKEHFYILEDNCEILKIDELLNNIKNAIIRYGVEVVVIDPFNKIEFSRTKDTTMDIGSVLNKLITFTHKHKILMFLVAHPTKPSGGERATGKQGIPSGFDIAGSANFQNMSDAIISVHRKQDELGVKSPYTRVTVSKWRFADTGREGSAFFKFDREKHQFLELDHELYEDTKPQKRSSL